LKPLHGLDRDDRAAAGELGGVFIGHQRLCSGKVTAIYGKAATIARDPTSLYIPPRMTQNTRPKQKARRPRGAPPSTAVIRVGEGRGFVVVDAERRARSRFSEDFVVITAAHCLPRFPPRASISDYTERTYKALLGPIGQDPTVWAECLFLDPISDIAVLGPPNAQDLCDQCDAFVALLEASGSLPIDDAPTSGSAWLLSLRGEWFRCNVQHDSGPLWITKAAEGIVGGMSGSPILADDGSAIGVLCTGQEEGNSGPNPRLVYHLPSRFLPPQRTRIHAYRAGSHARRP
jgi:hypothetical protein